MTIAKISRSGKARAGFVLTPTTRIVSEPEVEIEDDHVCCLGRHLVKLPLNGQSTSAKHD